MRVFMKAAPYIFGCAVFIGDPFSLGAEPVPRELLRTGEYLNPLLEKGRPWALVEEPAPGQIRQALVQLSEAAGQLEADFRDAIESADETRREFDALRRAPGPEPVPGVRDASLRDALGSEPLVERRVRSLAEAYLAEAGRIAQLDQAVNLLVRFDRRTLAREGLPRALRDLARRVRNARSASDALRVRVEGIFEESKALGESLDGDTLRMARVAHEQAWENEWRVERLCDSVEKLRLKAKG